MNGGQNLIGWKYNFMALVFIGDLHLNNWKQFSTILPNGINSRLAEQMKVVGQISSNLRDDDTVIFLGDLIDSYGETLPKIIYSAAFHTLRAWANKCEHLYAIIGNHDIYRNASIVTAFDEIDKVTIITDWNAIELEGYIVDMVAWNGSLPGSKGDIFAGHVMPMGAWMGSLWNKRADEGVPIWFFDGYKYAICGHVHEPQDLPVPKSETIVQCPGSIMQLNLSSSSAPRFLYRLENNKWSKIEIEATKLYTQIINTQEEADRFFMHHKPGYYKLFCMDQSIQLPALDHTIVVEYPAKPAIGKQEIEDVKDLDLLETIKDFIDNSNTAIDKELAKEYVTKLW